MSQIKHIRPVFGALLLQITIVGSAVGQSVVAAGQSAAVAAARGRSSVRTAAGKAPAIAQPGRQAPPKADLRLVVALFRHGVRAPLEGFGKRANDHSGSAWPNLEGDWGVCKDCWGDLSWDPRWFVSVHSTEEAWQVEAAIPLNELTGERIVANSAWAVNVTRILPGRGVQAWSLPADVTPRPEGMSLMIFHQEAKKAAAGKK